MLPFQRATWLVCSSDLSVAVNGASWKPPITFSHDISNKKTHFVVEKLLRTRISPLSNTNCVRIVNAERTSGPGADGLIVFRLAGLLLVILVAQMVLVALWASFVTFRVVGRDYEIIPIVGAFFIDIINAVVLTLLLSLDTMGFRWLLHK
jgi:hypothetical protein